MTITGKNIRRLFWLAAFAAAFIRFTPSASAEILKPGEIIYSRASTSPNGNCDTGAVWVVGQDGSNDRFITQGFHPRISPNGRYLIFKRFDPSSLCAPFSIGFKLWVRDLATNRETMISEQFHESVGYFFSPQTNRGADEIIDNDGQSICLMNSDGSNRTCTFIPNLDPIRGAGHMSVRGSDNLLLLQNFQDNTDGGLYTLDYDTLLNRQKVPNTVGRDLSPSWSNDGQKIAFAAYPATRAEPYFFTNLFKIDADGTNRTQLTSLTPPSGEGFSYSLIWTKDNLAIINAAKVNGVAGIYVILADGSGTMSQIPITPGAPPEWVGGIAPVYSEQQVAAFGGGLTGNENFSLVHTVGQGFAGQTSVAEPYSFTSGFWTLPTSAVGLEGDVAARPNGDGSVLPNDVILVRRFVNGTSTPDPATNEFQRADCAPRATSGDGIIGSNDIIQTRRYQNGTDPLQNAGGPTEGSAPVARPSASKSEVAAPRELRVQSVNSIAGHAVTVNMRVDALGDEAGYGFRLNYNNTRLLNPVVGAGTTGAAVRSCTQTTTGLNCAVDTFPNNSPSSSDPNTGEIGAGNDQVLISISFNVAASTPMGPLPLTLAAVNASNDNADLLTITSVNGAVNIGGPTAANVSIGGRLLTADGLGISNAVVSLTGGSNGEIRLSRSSSFGYYRFDDVRVGETYILRVSSKRYRFVPDTQIVTLVDELTELNFTAEP